MQEKWEPIQEVDGRYEVSNYGRVRNAKTGYLLAPRDNGRGYKAVAMHIGRNRYIHRYIHRLVACFFIENPNNYCEINHKDENKANNYAHNLEWCTRQYNNTYGNLTENKMKSVKQFTLNGVYVKTYRCINDVGGDLNITVAHIGDACKGKRKSCGGYLWKYANCAEARL